MKILLYGINFAPEPTGIGKYTGEMAAWLAAQGHEVRVVTAPPYYPAWHVGAGYSATAYRAEQVAGARVWRCPLWVPPQPGGLKRVLHLLSFAISSAPVVLWQATWRPDVVWVCAPAFACTPVAWLAARLSGARAWLHIQDYEVDVAFDMGLLKGRWVRRLVTGIERWLMRRFDVVSTISQRMLQRAAEKGVAKERIAFFPNWVDVDAVTPWQGTSPYRKKLGISDDQVVALFSGTLGAKQGLHLLPEAARLLQTDAPNVVVVICGDGVTKPALESACAGLPNVRMLPLQPKERVPELLGMADIHLLPQDPEVADLVMPSKLTAMLSSGRPVVTTARPDSEVAYVVARCGVLCEPGSAEDLATGIVRLAHQPTERALLGQAARAYAVARLGTQEVLNQFVAQCRASIAGAPLPDQLTAESA
ncbi:glycosyltransferase WbuB [Ideonella sp. 4Y16]|uniref:glycosyltransferase WbuB n=1 Tax=Ideonella alba TaxID=2824118 RepID=UPI001B361D44|nr:glycosyltransferase WbuB [Ideonella alba]MBQ0943128.1 glycosyltransferase WbuB [Ideonella alba]